MSDQDTSSNQSNSSTDATVANVNPEISGAPTPVTSPQPSTVEPHGLTAEEAEHRLKQIEDFLSRTCGFHPAPFVAR